jgi:Fe-S cluster biogenesis protein NfuA
MNWLKNIFRGDDNPEPTGEPDRVAEVEAVLARMRPLFLADGGDIRLIRVDEFGWVELRMHGACNSCNVSSLTLRGAIEPELKNAYEWVQGVRTV